MANEQHVGCLLEVCENRGEIESVRVDMLSCHGCSYIFNNGVTTETGMSIPQLISQLSRGHRTLSSQLDYTRVEYECYRMQHREWIPGGIAEYMNVKSQKLNFATAWCLLAFTSVSEQEKRRPRTIARTFCYRQPFEANLNGSQDSLSLPNLSKVLRPIPTSLLV